MTKKFISVLGLLGSNVKDVGNYEIFADFDNVIGILLLNFSGLATCSLSINNGEQVVVGTMMDRIPSEVSPNKRILFINKKVNRNDLIRITYQFATRSSLNLGGIYLLVSYNGDK